MSWWRLLLYELLTQAVVLLGWARRLLIRHQRQRRRTDRLFAVYADERWACCDCGLEHDQVRLVGPPCHPLLAAGAPEEMAHAWPMRPARYAYRLRAGAERPSLAGGAPPP